ncbi:hypothetical protein COC42_01715 [Sphingomonas spermidinifaciens]|uniref:Uncharacterized protein n=1 Tax=Sphingomonas spermidinifaciens TaxID=1141889 RepID=A0A2A4B694_9SPHN|nr:hypothetical protein [Sphingomonas spermidinifaciens]PCD03164.1 hypothetical protein COC42_01715 [Sphingomonas spermidinifaciens]
MKRALILGITMATAPMATAHAQDRSMQARADDLASDLARCATIAADAPRLACLDKASSALLSARDAGQVVILDREGMRRAKRKVFGFQLPKLGLFGDGDEADGRGEPEVKEIESTLARVTPIGGGLYILTLADGSQWQTTEGRVNFAPRKDQAIKIEAGILGSYNARVTGAGRGVKVKRVR